ncbi:phosphate ABC transporter permease subunit PstC [Pontibacillus yanchengensis]|uniref:Phosphate transport system permease protein n=1 Tax=Pontibacillus yanchengensis TaxID=462910 RepID=A0A6I5A337_9BACI|nr:phosphate ABC transporter permease subunit PstC [Pontibacillus yanchengensis]MYL33461.1 phosphate ABC transporter permease subunit PstC [Pontibacillus yanchengensis]
MASNSNEKTEQTSISKRIEKNRQNNGSLRFIEKMVPKLLLLASILSVLVTVGILYTLLSEAVTFFAEVNIFSFISGTDWQPWQGSFGVLGLVSGTLLITVIAMIVAIPVGVASAIFLSEYSSDKWRRILKPLLEVLAGIPTVVYGFFALTFVTPVLKSFIPDLSFFNALSAGIVVGVMIIPMIASLTEDAMSAVPNEMRQGALALGSTRLETTLKVVLPASLSGIVASFALGISRAIGETMIVAIAAGATPKFTMDPTQSIQTMTGYIVQVAKGDAGFGSTIYYSIYAVGATLFIFTLIMNLLAQYISRRYREEY